MRCTLQVATLPGWLRAHAEPAARIGEAIALFGPRLAIPVPRTPTWSGANAATQTHQTHRPRGVEKRRVS